MSDFDTTLSVISTNKWNGHPSQFQTPHTDSLLTKKAEVAKTFNPVDIWQRQMNKMSIIQNGGNERTSSGIRVYFDPNDHPLSKQETADLVAKLDPVILVTLNNTIPNLLFYSFFSKNNVKNLHRLIRYTVNKWSGFHVGEQSSIELTIIMEKIFTDYAQHIDEGVAPSKTLFKHIKNQIGSLNDLVVNEAAPIVINQIEQHVSFVKQKESVLDSSSLSRPIDTSITGTHIMRSISDIFT